MTCIVAIRHPDGGYEVGADRCVTDGTGCRMSQACPKIWQHGNAVIGVSGSLRACNVVKHALSGMPGKKATGLDFAQVIADALLGSEVYDPDNADDTAFDVLIAAPGELIYIDTQSAIIPVADEYFAIGSGSAYALGALYAIYGEHSASPGVVVVTALNAAARWDTGVCAPFDRIRVFASKKTKHAKR